MKVEVAIPDDAPEIARLGQLLHEASSYAHIPYRMEKVEDLMRNLANGAGVVFVVRRGGEIVGGIAGAVTEHWFSDELHGFEFSFFLRPDARSGITAGRLLNAFTTWCGMRGAKQVRVGITTGINEERTGEFYRAIGFEPAGALFKMEVSNGN